MQLDWKLHKTRLITESSSIVNPVIPELGWVGLISNSIFITCCQIQPTRNMIIYSCLQYVTLYHYQYFRPLPVDLLYWSTGTIFIRSTSCGTFILVYWDHIYTFHFLWNFYAGLLGPYLYIFSPRSPHSDPLRLQQM